MSTRHLLIILSLVVATQAFAQNTEFFGVFVGISDYETTFFDLQYADDDATYMRNYMTSTTAQHWPFAHTECLTNSDAAKQDILDAITAMPRPGAYEVTPADMFYFSGHGNDPTYSEYSEFPKGILTYSPNQAITPLDLYNTFGSSYNKYCVFIDACYSGMFPAGMGNGVICSSCQSSEVSVDDPPRLHGLWTYYLLQGLYKSVAGGTDGIVSAEELHDYAYQPTYQRAYSVYSISQPPEIGDNWSGNLNFKDTDDQAPDVPQNVSVTGTPGQHPTVHWDANAEEDLSGYQVYRKMPPYEADFHLIATVNSSTTSYTDTYIYVNSGTGDPTAYYYVKAYDGASNYSDTSSTVSTRVHPPGWPKISPDVPGRPTAHQLFEAYPNPFNPVTTIRYGLAEDAYVSLTVYNTQGQELAVLANGSQPAGFYERRFSGDGLASGIYFVRMNVTDALGKESYRRVTKLLLTK